MGSAVWKTIFREIKSSLGRFMAILSIIALGVGLFSGLRVTKTAMVATASDYLQEYQFFDLRAISTLGFDKDDIDNISEIDGIKNICGSISCDFIEGNSKVLKAHSLSDEINRVKLVSGKMPEKSNECVVDAKTFSESKIGSVITVSSENPQTVSDTFTHKEYIITGRADSPFYLNYERGTTKLGNGAVFGFVYIPEDGFSCDYYTEVYLTLENPPYIYTDEYEDALDSIEGKIENVSKDHADIRFNRIASEASEELNKGKQEYAEGLEKLETEKKKAYDELDKALKELQDAEKKLKNGEKEISENEDKLASAEEEIEKGYEEFNSKKLEAEETVKTAEIQLNDGENQIIDGLQQIEEKLLKIEKGKTEIEASKELLNASKEEYDLKKEEALAQLQLAEEQLDSAKVKIEKLEEFYGYADYALNVTKMEYEDFINLIKLLYPDLSEFPPEIQDVINGSNEDSGSSENANLLDALSSLLDESKAQYDEGLSEYEENYKLVMEQLDEGKAKLEASEKKLAETENTLIQGEKIALSTQTDLYDKLDEIKKKREEFESLKITGESELANAEEKLEQAEKELEDGKKKLKDAKTELANGKKDLEKGWNEYNKGKREADEELLKAEKELNEAKEKIEDGEEEIKKISNPEVYVLDRNTNIGYVCFENDSDIVQGVSTVFPIFFFLVAALVCITTMTRMVDEQRTQIGILKALGYGKASIMSKYMIYSGLSSVIGCVTGFLVGSYLFPAVIWNTYNIMYGFADIKFVFDIPLAVISLAVSLLCSVGTTWVSCYREFANVPAQLMRPKTPKSGKRVFLEKITFIWSRLKFLQKVSIRNILRYKKRLFMMILGISGCTALLVTGFGLNDSIKNIVTFQFDEITVYDYLVNFSSPLEDAEEAKFNREYDDIIENSLLVSQNTVDAEKEGNFKSTYMVVSDRKDISEFIDLHSKTEKIPYPEKGCAVINKKLAEILQADIGDTIQLKNGETDKLSVKVSGICENFINNYAFVNAETCKEQWGYVPEFKTGYVNVKENIDLREGSADISGYDDVISVTVNNDIKERFEKTLSSLNYIVILIIFCAGALAFIVLYNLTNINITERVREIATIKVLGFYKLETALYIFRENIVLTVVGAFVGLGLGKWLHSFVMSKIQVDLVCFDVRITLFSYFISIVLTVVFSLLVSVFMTGKLNKINMAESLKSIE